MNKLSAMHASARPAARSGSVYNPVNGIFGWLTIAVVCLMPLAFGSFHPFMWALGATLIGLCCLAYIVANQVAGYEFRVPLSAIAVPALLFAAFCATLVIQVIPFGAFSIPTPTDLGLTAPQISVVPGTTIMALLAYLSYGMVFWMMLQVGANDHRRQTLFNAILLAILAYAAFGLLTLQLNDTLLGLPKWDYDGSATGPFVNRNSFATFLAFGAVLTVSNITALLRRRLDRHVDDGRVPFNTSMLVLNGVAYAFLAVTIIATQSRMGLMVACLGSLIVAIPAIPGSQRVRRIALFAVLLATLLGIALTFYGTGLMERLGSLDHDAEVRGDLYVQVLRLIAERPFIGFGAGSFNLSFPLVHTLPVSPDLVWSRAHNSYLALWAEMGLIAGSIPMLILAIFGFRLLRALLGGRGDAQASLVGLAILAVAAVHSLVDFSLEIHGNAMVFMAIFGLAFSGAVSAEKRKQ
jgi:O-antigen ligase